MIVEKKANIWNYWKQGQWICVTTNNFVRSDGCAVMGRGVAMQAKAKMPRLPWELGHMIRESYHEQGSSPGERNFEAAVPFVFQSYKVVTFPVKFKWWEQADLELIKRSGERLMKIIDGRKFLADKIYLPRPGCGNGGLKWNGKGGVREALEPILDERVVVVSI